MEGHKTASSPCSCQDSLTLARYPCLKNNGSLRYIFSCVDGINTRETLFCCLKYLHRVICIKIHHNYCLSDSEIKLRVIFLNDHSIYSSLYELCLTSIRELLCHNASTELK